LHGSSNFAAVLRSYSQARGGVAWWTDGRPTGGGWLLAVAAAGRRVGLPWGLWVGHLGQAAGMG
jgi:hypothetical protein